MSCSSFQHPFDVFVVAGILIRLVFFLRVNFLQPHIDAGLLSDEALNKGLLSACFHKNHNNFIFFRIFMSLLIWLNWLSGSNVIWG